MHYFAFFDLDKTILKINSGKLLFKKARQAGIISRRRYYAAFFLSFFHYFKILDAAVIIRWFPKWLSSINENEFIELCRELVDSELIPLIRPEIRNEIEIHQSKGASVVMLSATIDLICDPIAKHLNMNSVICTELEVKDGHLSGKTHGPICFREEKWNRLSTYIMPHDIKLNDVYYYGDSVDDLPVLKSVGFPVCVYPDAQLKRIAKKMNWKVIDK